MSEAEQKQYVNLVRSVRLFKGTSDAYLIPQYLEEIKRLEAKLGAATPTDIHESGTHRVTYFVNNHFKELF
jgi:hypothetical protein